MKKRSFIFLFVLLSVAARLFSLTDEPVAVLLAGGGARGAYQIGVWKALKDLDVDIGAIYGVSVGAINGAVMAEGDFQMAKELWLKLEKQDVMNLNDSTERVLNGNFSLQELLDAALGLYSRGGIDVNPLENLLRENVHEDAVRESGIEYGLAAFSVTDMKQKYYRLEDIPEGRLVDYILASANFPIFQRQIIDGEEFIDGGIRKNLVIDMIDKSKYEHVIIISLNLYMPEDLRDLLSGYLEYGLDVQLIAPEPDLGNLLDFNPKSALTLMRRGYLDGLRTFGKISGLGYYIYGTDTIRKMFIQLEPWQRQEAARLLELDVPEGEDFSNGDYIYNSYIQKELLLFGETNAAILELLSLFLGLPRDVLYSEAELIEKIVDNYVNRKNNDIYYNRYLDFLSYLSLNSGEVVYTDQEFDSKFLAGYREFEER